MLIIAHIWILPSNIKELSYFLLQQCFSNCGLQIISSSSTWELLEILVVGPNNFHFNKPCKWFWCKLIFENHSSIATFLRVWLQAPGNPWDLFRCQDQLLLKLYLGITCLLCYINICPLDIKARIMTLLIK